MSINDRIKTIRAALKKTQRDFAKDVYVSYGYLSEVETGKKEASERLIHLINTIYAVSRNWLLTGEGRMFNSTQQEKLDRMTALFNELDPGYQDFILQQIDSLLSLQNQTAKPAPPAHAPRRK